MKLVVWQCGHIVFTKTSGSVYKAANLFGYSATFDSYHSEVLQTELDLLDGGFKI